MTSPATSTSYNTGSQPTSVTLGSGDSDAFSYDASTGRMTQYKFTVGATPQSVIGNLTWNANGSLQQLQITDPFNSANAQTCTYLYDDLARIGLPPGSTGKSVDCGATKWQDNYSYDAFGNITKTVPTGGTGSSFQPTYSSATNRMTALPGFTPTYDANGNVSNDQAHQYSWDAEGRPVNADGVGLTYDALGRMVEQTRSGPAYAQIVYGPTGGKLALMNGQTLSKAFVPLPGGGTAVYNSAGLQYYRHSDWLGSSRFASTPTTRAMYSDTAYAPFGETYAASGTADPSFTGQNQDTAANVYDFMFREYATQGRWPSPDPAGLGAVDPSSPQSWNRYAYVMNNPLSLTDPLGLFALKGDACDFFWWICDHGGGDGGGGISITIGIGGGGGSGGGHAGANNQLPPRNPVSFPPLGTPPTFPGAWPISCGNIFFGSCPDPSFIIFNFTVQNGTLGGSYPGEQLCTTSGLCGYWTGETWRFIVYVYASSGGVGLSLRAPDFWQITLSAGLIAGYTFSLSWDRYGHFYWAPIGGNIGKSLYPVSASFTPGWLIGYNQAPNASDLKNFLTSWGCSAGGGYWGGYLFGWSSGGQANTPGFVSPQGGISCGYSWQIH